MRLILLLVIIYGLTMALPGPELMDFGSFMASGQAAGQGLDPYGIYPLTFRVELPGFNSWNPNLNPPPSLPLFHLLSRLEPAFAFRLWWAISAVCYCAAVALLARRGWLAVLWAFALAGFWDSLVLGQIYLPLVLATVAAWCLLERDRVWSAGLLIGLVVAVKPNFTVWPALLLMAGHYRPVMAAMVSAALLAGFAVLLYGPQVYGQWLALVLNDANRAVFLTNASLSGLAQRLGVPSLGTLSSLGLLAWLAWWAWRRRLPVLQASALGLVGAVLASPIAWVHYTLFLLPIFFAFPATPLLVLSAALLVVPVPLVLHLLEAPWWLQASLGSVYGWAVVLCLLALRPLPKTEVAAACKDGAR
ncbi:MAG: DUF2029 domain-containing protein [Rhodospirillaceae bacterium]|nr:DUF2029 domain-containing protein [Rhodospirillales bacterium]